MKLITASLKHAYGNAIFHIDMLYPGEVLSKHDTGFYTIGRIDHARFGPPGFIPMHPHRNDEILSYIRSGEGVHKDSAGNEKKLNATYDADECGKRIST